MVRTPAVMWPNVAARAWSNFAASAAPRRPDRGSRVQGCWRALFHVLPRTVRPSPS